MGEEEKKPQAEAAKPDPPKEEPPKAAEPTAPPAEDGEKKASEAPPPPPPPPEEVVLQVYMHCEGCARKVKRSLKGFDGVEDVKTDCKTHKVVVKGRKAAEDPLKVLERVQKKTGRKVELLSAMPPPKPEPKPEEKKVEEAPKPEEKKVEPPVVITAVLKVHMHCDACAQEMKKRILKMKGVESAEPDMKSSEVIVKGVFDASKLVEHVYKRTGKHAVLVKQEPAEKPEVEAAEKGKEEVKAEAKADGEGEKKAEGEEKEKKDVAPPPEEAAAAGKPEIKRNEYMYYYNPRMVDYNAPRMVDYNAPRMVDYAAYPPQMFSDENPNACSLM